MNIRNNKIAIRQQVVKCTEIGKSRSTKKNTVCYKAVTDY